MRILFAAATCAPLRSDRLGVRSVSPTGRVPMEMNAARVRSEPRAAPSCFAVRQKMSREIFDACRMVLLLGLFAILAPRSAVGAVLAILVLDVVSLGALVLLS